MKFSIIKLLLMEYKTEFLNNDIPVFIDRLKSRTLGIAIIVETGSIYEDPKYRGISHFLEHMMFKTNKKYKAEEINKLLELNGGISNAFTSRFQTVYLAETLSEGFHKVVDVLYSMFENELYLDKEFELEKRVVLSEIEMRKNNPENRIDDLLMLSIYGKSDYGEPIGGYRHTLSNITKDTLLEYKIRNYVPENIKILLIGDIRKYHIDLLNKTFGNLPGGSIKKKIPKKEESKIVEERMDTKNQVYVGMGIRLPIDVIYKVENISLILSGGLSSIIFNVFRERYGIGYSTFAGVFDKFPDEIVFAFVTYGLEKEKLDQYNNAVEETIDELKKSTLEYIEGRKRRFKVQIEKIRNDIYKRLYRESTLLSLLGENLDRYIYNILSLDPRENYHLIENIDKYSKAFIYPLK